MAVRTSCVIGVDVGGTNTDAVILLGDRIIAAEKSPTTPDRTTGIINAIRAAVDTLSPDDRTGVLRDVVRVSIGTTHFVNAVVARDESRLARVAVIRLCGSATHALPPFADFPEELRRIVDGGVHMVSGGREYNGAEIDPLVAEELRDCVREIAKQKSPVRNVVICSVFSPQDTPACSHESQAAQIVQQQDPGISVTLSHTVGLLGLLERENAAILNESLKPLAVSTISAFRKALDELGLNCPFFLTQNDGTLISAEDGMRCPVLTFSSGPTNSMRGAMFLSGLGDAVVVDVGGTSTDVGVIVDGFPREASTQVKVGEVRTNFRMPDVPSISLGGGSLVCWEDGKTEKGDVPVLLVGGGSILLDKKHLLKGASVVITPPHFEVANAVGAALGTVGGLCDLVEDVGQMKGQAEGGGGGGGGELQARELAKEKAIERATAEALAKGADQNTISIHSVDIVPLAYVEGRVRVRAKVIGCLGNSPHRLHLDHQPVKPALPVDAAHQLERNGESALQIKDRACWPYSTAGDREMDLAAGLHEPTVRGGEWFLNEEDIECLSIGAGILGCGGGGDPNLGRIMAQRLLADGREIKIVNPCRLDPSTMGLFTAVAFMGAPVVLSEKLVSGTETVLSYQTLQKVLASDLYDKDKDNDDNCDTCKQRCGGKRDEADVGDDGGGGTSTCSHDGDDGAPGKESSQQVSVTCKSFEESSVWLADSQSLEKIDITDLSKIPLNKRITGILCAEIGGMNSLEPLIVGAKLGLPVPDADGMGRAFPELQMYLPFIYGRPCYPSCVADSKGEVVCCTYVEDATGLERFFRGVCVKQGMASGVAIGALTLSEVLKTCVHFSVSNAWQLGRAVARARKAHLSVVESVCSHQEGKLIIVGKVLSVDRVSEKGFTKSVVIVEGLDEFLGHRVKILAKNENYIIRYLDSSSAAKLKDGPVLACTPDLICAIDSDEGFPITTEAVRYGMRVAVLVIPANPLLKTPQAMRVVGPAAFGFGDIQYAPPQTIKDIRHLVA